jgi:hypothetical protein
MCTNPRAPSARSLLHNHFFVRHSTIYDMDCRIRRAAVPTNLYLPLYVNTCNELIRIDSFEQSSQIMLGNPPCYEDSSEP